MVHIFILIRTARYFIWGPNAITQGMTTYNPKTKLRVLIANDSTGTFGGGPYDSFDTGDLIQTSGDGRGYFQKITISAVLVNQFSLSVDGPYRDLHVTNTDPTETVAFTYSIIAAYKVGSSTVEVETQQVVACGPLDCARVGLSPTGTVGASGLLGYSVSGPVTFIASDSQAGDVILILT